jgi:hypothetical protein
VTKEWTCYIGHGLQYGSPFMVTLTRTDAEDGKWQEHSFLVHTVHQDDDKKPERFEVKDG